LDEKGVVIENNGNKSILFVVKKKERTLCYKKGSFCRKKIQTLFSAVSSFLSLSSEKKQKKNNPFKERKSNSFQLQWQINSPMIRSLSSRKPSACSIRMAMVSSSHISFFLQFFLRIFDSSPSSLYSKEKRLN